MPKANRQEIGRQEMPTRPAEERIKCFDEVALGYTMEMAVAEASRCIQCKKPLCMSGCPVQVRIPDFILAVREGRLREAAELLKDKNSLPAICGRVCPQESQCESKCVLGRRGEPVAIGRLERFVADWERSEGVTVPAIPEATGKRVAVIGAGPAGLTVAGDLAKLGHSVEILEALHVPGGVLMYGIPEFRLPKEVVRAEVNYLEKLGVQIRTDVVVGKLFTLEELLASYDAVFLGTGAGLPMMMNIPGENYNGVYSANELLTRTNLMKGYLFPQWDTPVKVGDRVAVVGAGNVAMDAARCALRLGASEVHIVYRRSREEVPARAEEVHHAEEEGIVFDFLTNPVEVLGDENGWVCGLRCIRMELGEPDASGRRRPIPIEGSEFEMPMDTVVMALGTQPNPLVFTEANGLERSRWGTVVADERTGRTKMPRVWAGGDIVTGAATVISAMGAGRIAATDIDAYLKDPSGSWWPDGNA
ncbi:MAG TPA: NADPH-dependent glutamate synthase [Chloroflexi bacterium]|jgi:glutamate synthase (NADPH/NADH) small chain|nr:NADPH-dependent glutamate synthase [Chloroflexota bacterium]